MPRVQRRRQMDMDRLLNLLRETPLPLALNVLVPIGDWPRHCRQKQSHLSNSLETRSEQLDAIEP